MKIKREISNLSISSVSFPNVYLHMDGAGVHERKAPGFGVVNCQFGAFYNELFKFTEYENNTYTIESMKYPGVFLRMDGNGVSAPSSKCGTVNCQFGAYEWEYFRIHDLGDGGYTIESVQFSDVFLCMDGTTVKAYIANGSGTVNGQFGAQTWSKVHISEDLKTLK